MTSKSLCSRRIAYLPGERHDLDQNPALRLMTDGDIAREQRSGIFKPEGDNAIRFGRLDRQNQIILFARPGLDCYTSRLATFSAFSWMNSRRGSTTSPI